MSSAWMELKAEAIAQYQQQKQLADAALAGIDDTAFFTHLKEGGDNHTNSIAILVKHLSGNLISRWTDFLTSDGEKADRQRPREFMAEANDTRLQIMERWEERLALPLHQPRSAHRSGFCQNCLHPRRGAQRRQGHPTQSSSCHPSYWAD